MLEKNLLDTTYHYLIDASGEHVTVTNTTRALLATPNASLATKCVALATANIALASKDCHLLARSTGHAIFSRGGAPALSPPNAPLLARN